MKATKIQLTPKNAPMFERFHEEYRGYSMAKNALEDAEADMKEARSNWAEATPQYGNAPGAAGLKIVNEGGELVASFTKARAVSTLYARGYIDAVLAAAGATESQRTTVTGLLRTTGLLEEISFSARLAKKVHPIEWEAYVEVEDTGARTVKFL